MRILLATNNRHKAAEMAAILSDIDGIELVTPSELPTPVPDPVEDGATLEENAYIKAREIFLATGIPAIADDTGLEVAALDGAPGVRSARFAGEDATYADNCNRLLAELAERGAEDRSARFRTVICLTDAVRTLFAEGSVDGEILLAPAGAGGFGYDPLFRPAGSEQSFAEMPPERKNAVSHRGRALAALRETLTRYIHEAD